MKNIERLFKNDIAKKILLFFNENPQCIDTAKGISVWVGCDMVSVQKALNRLVKEGIIINHKATSTNAYSYTNHRIIVKKIERYIKHKVPHL
jgi:predicted transcriptional regulator